jgi:hypothetical protein
MSDREPNDAVNLTGMGYYEIESVEVAEFHPLPNGQGSPTQVHVIMTITELDYPLTMRIKSRQACEQLIHALMTHSKAVWP